MNPANSTIFTRKKNMLTFISCAKTMTARSNVRVPFTTVPPFETAAKEHALNLSQFSTQELEKLLRINSKLAATNDTGTARLALLYRYGIQAHQS